MYDQPLQLLGGLTPRRFLAEYWQKKPLFVRGALPGYTSPVAPDEIAGLACEEEVESRLVMEKGGVRPWQVEQGPLSEQRFTRLPEQYWTLLVQEANKHVPDFALLQERFRFLPNWRLDDVMVSYAADLGSVGPHADNYDVFLIQGFGRRRWQINLAPPGPDDLIPDLPLKIMRRFEAEQEWIVEPGDLLYLPPGVAHHGVALGESITVSVGFRAPSLQDLLARYCGDTLAGIDPESFYGDPDLAPQANPGEIDAAARERLRGMIRDTLLRDDAAIDRWFGSYITDIKPGHELPEPPEELEPERLRALLAGGAELWRSEYCRYAHFERDGVTYLFVAGDEFPVEGELAGAAALLAGQRIYPAGELLPWFAVDGFAELLADLYNGGGLWFPELYDE